MHHIYYSKEKFIETDGKAVFIIYHLPKMEGAKRMSEQTYMYEPVSYTHLTLPTNGTV